MSERFEQASLEGLDLDERLAELPLRRSPQSPKSTSEDRGGRSDEEPFHNLDLFGGQEEPSSSDHEVEEEEAAKRSPAVSAAGTPAEPVAGEPADAGAEWESPAPAERLLGGLADLTVHVGVMAAALLAMSSLSLTPAIGQWPGFLTFVLSFSFLYHVVPLAFWGQTPGMAWRGLRARDAAGRPLSFGQSGLRWMTALVTAGLLGLPLLLASGGRGSLSDRATRSATLRRV